MLAIVLAAVLAEAPTSASADPWMDGGDAEESTGVVLTGRSIPSLVEIAPLSMRIEPDEVPVGEETTTGHAVVALHAEVQHSFDGAIRDVQLGVAILSRTQMEFVWRHLLAPPVRVVSAELERPLPYPTAVVTASFDGSLTRDDSRTLDVREELESIELSRTAPLGYIAALGGYELESPSVDDVVRVLDEGGPIDLSALASWATQAATDETSGFDDDARGRIMDAVERSARALRAPPGWGDFARLSALTALAYACARPEDLERLLALQRPMGILLASGIVSWDAAATEEHTVGVSIHGFSPQQSRSQAAISWESALKHLRITALDRLLRLSFDPIDFRNAPTVLRRSPLQPLADDLLDPLAPTQVARVLASAGSEATEAAILRYYVEVRHEAVAEPLIEWLIEHPTHVDDLGVPSMIVLGEAILPVLLRRHGEVDASEAERAVLWRMLDALPERLAAPLAHTAFSLGVELPVVPHGSAPTVADVLAAIRRHERELRAARADELAERLREDAGDLASLRIRIRAASQLAALAPERIPALTDELIELHTRAAMELDDEQQGEVRMVLRQLVELPLGERAPEALCAAAVTRSDLAQQHGDTAAALAELEAHDPELADAEVRERYAKILRREAERGIESGDFTHVDETLDRADARVPDLVDVASLRLELARKRNFPLVVAGAVIIVVLSALGGWLLHKLVVVLRRRARERAADVAASDAREQVPSLDTDVSDVGVARPADRSPPPGSETPQREPHDLDPFAKAPSSKAPMSAGWQSSRDDERERDRDRRDSHNPLDDF